MTLRNKPGGLARVNSNVDDGSGASVLIGCYVVTEYFTEGGYWRISPSLHYVTARMVRFGLSGGTLAPKGELVTVTGLVDDCLTPVPDIDLSDETETEKEVEDV